MRSAESIWLLSLASIATGPPRRPEARISSGRKPSSPGQRMSAPSARRASMRPLIGLLRICATPSIRYTPPFADAQSAVRKRAAVPARPVKSSASARGDRAAAPLDPDPVRGLVLLDAEAEAAERLGHDPRVLAEQRPGEGHRAVAERGEQERAVREALGARQGHAAAGRPDERPHRKDVG